MAGVAQNVQVVSSDKSEVFEPDLTFNINTSESTSLQELIDSELALRISNSDSQEPETELTETIDTSHNSYLETIPVRTVHPIKFELEPDVNEQFIFSEKEHTSFQLINNNVNLNTSETLITDCDVLSTDDLNLYENLIVIKSNTQTTESNSEIDRISQDTGSTDIFDTKQVETPVTDLDSTAVSSPEAILDTQLIDITSIDDNQPQCVDVIETVIINETSISEPSENSVVTNCDLSEQNNKISTNVVDVIESLNSDNDVNNSMSENNCRGVDLINDVNPLIVFPDEPLTPVSFTSPVNSESPGISPSSPVEDEHLSPSSPLKVDDLSPSSQPDVIIQVNGAAPVFEEDGFDTWMTVEDAMKDPNDSSPDENIAQQSEIFDVFETIDDGHYEDVIERSRLESENSFDIELTKQTESIVEEQKNVDQSDGDATCVPVVVHDQSPTVSLSDQSMSDGDLTESSTTMTKTVKKKKSLDGGEAVVTRTKKTKKTKKSEEKENHISVKSSFSKFDQLSKKGAVLHVRSSDSAKAQKQFQGSTEGVSANPSCKDCGKQVFAMEQIKAERSVWHKNCFRCKECNKQLTVDIYQSHEGELYCKPHFRELFKPKAVLENAEDEPVRRRKPEMIIRENQPMELPPDVVRASDKVDLGLEELSSLNVKSRFQVFEKPTSESEVERSPSTVNVKRSPSILSKLARFQKKGMDVGVTDESLNGVEYEESSSSSEEENEEGIIKSSKLPERPVSFNKMDDVKRSWESGHTTKREEMREVHKKEIQNMRSRLFMGKQGKMKEMYEQAVAESEGRAGSGSAKKEVEQLRSEKARLMKERFEKGEPITDSEDEDGEKKKTKETEDMSVFEAGISKKSRSLFMELDATAAKTQQATPSQAVHTPTPRARTSSQNEESPDREIYRDPGVVRSEDQVDDDELVKRSHTTSKMLSLFRQMEEAKEPVPEGLKPLKCFTPPPDYKEDQSGSSGEEDDDESEEEGEESEDDTGIVRSSDKIEDESLKQAQNAARAKALKEKFEHWEPEKQSVNNAINLLDTEQDSLESTKSLRARFESLKSEQPTEKARPKVNRFVETPATNICAACDKKVYHLEKVEASGKLFHKDCFRCTQCNCKLRMESYTLNNGQVYCLPHFRQLFIAKGNYDEGFGSDQHKRKWEPTQTVNGAH